VNSVYTNSMVNFSGVGWSVSCLTWNLCFAMGLINLFSLTAGNVNSHINVY
jgi:hypothetical protein